MRKLRTMVTLGMMAAIVLAILLLVGLCWEIVSALVGWLADGFHTQALPDHLFRKS